MALLKLASEMLADCREVSIAAPPRSCNNPKHSWGEPCARRPQCLGDKLPLTSFFAPKSNADGRRLEWQQDKLLRYRLVLFMASLLASLACIVYRALISFGELDAHNTCGSVSRPLSVAAK